MTSKGQPIPWQLVACALAWLSPACAASLPNGTLIPEELCSLLPAQDGRPAIMVSAEHHILPDVDEDAVWACVASRCELILAAHNLGAVHAAWVDPFSLQIETTAYGIRYFDPYLRKSLFSSEPTGDAFPIVGLISGLTMSSTPTVTQACPLADGHTFIARQSW